MLTKEATHTAGLEGVIAGTSEICYVYGEEGRLIYHGYDIHDLVNGGSSFEEVIYLLWHGDLPTQTQLKEFTREIASKRNLDESVLSVLKQFPKDANPMDVLRSAVSVAGLFDPDTKDDSREANIRKAQRLVAQIPTIATTFERIRVGKEPIAPNPELSTAASFFYLLNGAEPDEFQEKAFNTALILHADHELNASTFSARVTAATLSDMYSAIVSAIGTLKGPLHGGANERVMRMLLDIGNLKNAENWIQNAIANKQKIMGFGHRVYRTEDPRATHLRQLSKEAGQRYGQPQWYEMSQFIEQYVFDQKGLYPNVDFYSGSTYYAMGIPVHLFTPVFACSRIAGWSAHVLEQYANNRLIRPRSEYTGPTQNKYVPLSER